jgi:hypothetical protein
MGLPGRAGENRPGAFSVSIESKRALDSRFEAFSSREPVPTLLENALKGLFGLTFGYAMA